MCVIIVDGEEAAVNKTSIFARHKPQGRQLLVYSMALFTNKPAVMILPLPVKHEAHEQSLSFIDLSAYSDFFTDMYQGFPPIEEMEDSGEEGLCVLDDAPSPPPLVVHNAGDFEASFVPHRDDFRRLDKRFQLDESTWEDMPDYHDFGFAVFQIKPSRFDDVSQLGKSVHPMAFEFDSRDSTQLFYPTVHVHDGEFHQRADFDHIFYSQFDHDVKGRLATFEKHFYPEINKDVNDERWHYHYYQTSEHNAKDFVKVDLTSGIVVGEEKIHRLAIKGEFNNQDHWL